MLDDIAKGVHYSVIAGKHKISLRTVRREIGRALDQHWIETPQRHIRLQVARLTDALRLIDDAMLDGRLDAIDPLLKVLDRLDRYNALGQPVEKPRLLALTHSGHESAPIALDSLVPDLSAPLEKP